MKAAYSLRKRLLYSFLFGTVFTVIAVLTMIRWHEADWFAPTNKLTYDIDNDTNEKLTVQGKWAGFDAIDFIFLMLWTFATPIGACLIMTFFQFCVRGSTDSKTKSGLFVSFVIPGALLSVLLWVCIFWSRQVLECGILGCVNTASRTYEGNTMNLREGAVGWYNFTGIMTMFAVIPFLIAVLANFFTNWYIIVNSPKNDQIAQNSHDKTRSKGALNTNAGDSASLLSENLLSDSPSIKKSASDKLIGFFWDTKASSTKSKQSFFYFIFIVTIIALLVISFLTTTYIPNAWTSFTPYKIANKSMLKAVSKAAECQIAGNHCPEVEFATFRTFYIPATDYVNLHFFPGNVAFYVYLILVVLLASIQHIIPSVTLHNFLNKKWRVQYRSLTYYVTAPFRCIASLFQSKKNDDSPQTVSSIMRLHTSYFSVRELIWILLTTGMVYIFSHYWIIDHNFHNHWPRKETILSERICRAFGQIAVLFFALLMFPAARNSPMYSILGLSWEGAMKYHRWMGFGFLLTSIVHMLTAYWWYYDAGVFPGDIIEIPQKLPPATNNFTVPHAQWTLWFAIIALGITSSFESIRRRRFEFFLICHHLSFLVLIPALLWHAAAAWEFMLPPCVMWIIDRAMRFYRSSRAVFIPKPEELNSMTYQGKMDDCSRSLDDGFLLNSGNACVSTWGLPKSVAVGEPGASVVVYGQAGGRDVEVVELVLRAPGLDLRPGHYVFLNVAEVSLFEWHPFTVSSSYRPGSDIFTLHIQSMGEGSWTQSLAKLIRENAAAGVKPQQGLTISVDGPHGTPVDFTQYDRILLVSGGIGMTPCKSIFETLLTSAHAAATSNEKMLTVPKAVNFLCVSRVPALFHLMRYSCDTLVHAPKAVKELFAMNLFSSPNASTNPMGYVSLAESRVDESSSSGATTVNQSSATIQQASDTFPAFPGNSAMTSVEAGTEHNSGNPFRLSGDFLKEGQRPKISELLPEFASKHIEKVRQQHPNQKVCETSEKLRTLLFVCGPTTLIEECEGLAKDNDWTFHSEHFLL